MRFNEVSSYPQSLSGPKLKEGAIGAGLAHGTRNRWPSEQPRGIGSERGEVRIDRIGGDQRLSRVGQEG